MSLTDYSQMEEEIKNAPEMEILPDNFEGKIRIVKVECKVIDNESKPHHGAPFNMITFDVPSEPNAPMFSHFMWDLNAKGKIDEKWFLGALRDFRDFAAAFNIDYSRPFDWEDLVNLEGWAVLKVIKDKSGEYPDKNGVKKFVTPK